MNVRFNRCIFNQAYSFERPAVDKQPTYAYLFKQQKVSDETWRVDGVNDPSLPCGTCGRVRAAPGSGLGVDVMEWGLVRGVRSPSSVDNMPDVLFEAASGVLTLQVTTTETCPLAPCTRSTTGACTTTKTRHVAPGW